MLKISFDLVTDGIIMMQIKPIIKTFLHQVFHIASYLPNKSMP